MAVVYYVKWVRGRDGFKRLYPVLARYTNAAYSMQVTRDANGKVTCLYTGIKRVPEGHPVIEKSLNGYRNAAAANMVKAVAST